MYGSVAHHGTVIGFKASYTKGVPMIVQIFKQLHEETERQNWSDVDVRFIDICTSAPTVPGAMVY